MNKKTLTSAHDDSSIYIYIYIWGGISRVQGSKAGSPRRASGAKNDFLGVPVSEPSVNGPQGSLEMVLRTFLAALGSLWEVLGTSKNLHSVQYILKKS